MGKNSPLQCFVANFIADGFMVFCANLLGKKCACANFYTFRMSEALEEFTGTPESGFLSYRLDLMPLLIILAVSTLVPSDPSDPLKPIKSIKLSQARPPRNSRHLPIQGEVIVSHFPAINIVDNKVPDFRWVHFVIFATWAVFNS